MMKLFIPEIQAKVKEAKSIVISTHVSPDGDAIGSSLALYHFLKNKGKNVQVVVPNAFPEFLAWLPESAAIVVYDKEELRAKQLISEADLIFSLDYNETHRTAMVQAALDASMAFKILIDHHIGEPTWPNINLSTVGASSTCELVFDFMDAFDSNENYLTLAIAQCVYTGLLTDTGNFQFSATTPKVHKQAARLLEMGVQPDRVNNYINNSFNEQRMQFFGFCVSKRMKMIPEKKLAYILVKQEDLYHYNIQTGGTEGLVNEPMKISNVDISVLFKEDTGKIKLSFRSKKDIDISKFAHQYFKGGGHKNAAGGVSYKSLQETEADFLLYLKDFNID